MGTPQQWVPNITGGGHIICFHKLGEKKPHSFKEWNFQYFYYWLLYFYTLILHDEREENF